MKKGINPIWYLSYLFQIITRRKIHGPQNRGLEIQGPLNRSEFGCWGPHYFISPKKQGVLKNHPQFSNTALFQFGDFTYSG